MAGRLTLWDFAVRLHARPGVEEACLTLQDDHGQCVPLLMWRLWALDRPIDTAVLRSAINVARAWDGAAVAPLRTLRRSLRQPVPAVADTDRLNVGDQVKAAELAAERALLNGLEALTPKALAAAVDAGEALADMTAAWGATAPRAMLARLADAAASGTG